MFREPYFLHGHPGLYKVETMAYTEQHDEMSGVL